MCSPGVSLSEFDYPGACYFIRYAARRFLLVLLTWAASLWLVVFGFSECHARMAFTRKLEVLVTYSYTIWALEITYGLQFQSVSLRCFALGCSCLYISISAIVQDPCRMGVWLGWHICYNATQVSQGQLRENRNLSSSIRVKAVLIYVLSVPVHNEQYSYV
jgi:hypothetical protein